MEQNDFVIAAETRCKGCTPDTRVPVERIISKLDSLFASGNITEAGRLLSYWEKEAEMLGDTRGLLSIVNEQLGYYRRVGDSQKGLSAVDKALALIGQEDMYSTVSGATVLLNAATTMKAFGKARQALDVYTVAGEIYSQNLAPDDFRIAGFYNNLATALGELQMFQDAFENYSRAAQILKKRGDSDGELAVTYVNMAYLPMCDPNEYILKAWALLDGDTLPRDGNYAFIADKCAPAFEQFGFAEIQAELLRRKEAIYAGH